MECRRYEESGRWSGQVVFGRRRVYAKFSIQPVDLRESFMKLGYPFALKVTRSGPTNGWDASTHTTSALPRTSSFSSLEKRSGATSRCASDVASPGTSAGWSMSGGK